MAAIPAGMQRRAFGEPECPLGLAQRPVRVTHSTECVGERIAGLAVCRPFFNRSGKRRERLIPPEELLAHRTKCVPCVRVVWMKCHELPE